MRLSFAISAFLVALLCFGCADKKNGIPTKARRERPTVYRYAYSGQVTNETTGEVIEKFSVDIIHKDGSINALLNSLGSENGVFHVSRVPRMKDSSTAVLPLILTAPGYEPLVVKTEIGKDGDASRPTLLQMKPIANIETNRSALSLYFPPTLSLLMETRGTRAIFKELNNQGKLDALTADLLAKAKNKDTFQDVLVILNGNSSGKTDEIIRTLLSAPLVAELQAKAETLTPSVSPLLVYLQNYLPNISQEGKPVQAAGVNSFESILFSFLKSPSTTDWSRDGKRDVFSLALDHLQPLLQGFQGRGGDELAGLFNELVKRQGINGIKAIVTQSESHEKFSKLLPFVESIKHGLESSDAPYLTEVLNQVLAQADPAKTLVSLFSSSGEKNRFSRKVSVLYPSAAHLWQEGVIGKQVFAAQILQGVFTGDLHLMKVTHDLTTAPAVILTGEARDIFKIAQLPNVQKIFVLK